VNCICPGWVDTPASRCGRAQMTPQERKELVPPVLLAPEEIADVVVMFVEDEAMARRVMIWQEGTPWRIVPPDAPH
jgi:NAD(P)-dependent dehydrogenase (short-subunit alcohol dehydrogenase family)